MPTSSVSVIVPAYNYGKYIGETLMSIFAQSVPAHEIIVVDDESTDNTAEIVAKYPVTYIHQKNKGLSGARNTGIRAATGTYIMSVDADDILRPDCIKAHLELADEQSIVTCGLMAFGNDNYTARPREATVDILLKTNVIYSNTLFPKKAWEVVGGFDESETMRLGWEDREFWLRVVGAGYKSKVGDYIGLLWRRHGNNMSNETANPNSDLLQSYIYEKNKHLNKPTTVN